MAGLPRVVLLDNMKLFPKPCLIDLPYEMYDIQHQTCFVPALCNVHILHVITC